MKVVVEPRARLLVVAFGLVALAGAAVLSLLLVDGSRPGTVGLVLFICAVPTALAGWVVAPPLVRGASTAATAERAALRGALLGMVTGVLAWAIAVPLVWIGVMTAEGSLSGAAGALGMLAVYGLFVLIPVMPFAAAAGAAAALVTRRRGVPETR